MPKWTSGQARKETSVEDVNTCPHQHPGRLSQTRTVVVERDCDSPVSGGDDPDSPPLPLPPPNPDNRRRSVLGSFGALRIGAITPRGAGPRSLVSTRSSPTGSQSENEGYNSSDEHMPSFIPSHSGSGSGSGSVSVFFFQKYISLKPVDLLSINVCIWFPLL